MATLWLACDGWGRLEKYLIALIIVFVKLLFVVTLWQWFPTWVPQIHCLVLNKNIDTYNFYLFIRNIVFLIIC